MNRQKDLSALFSNWSDIVHFEAQTVLLEEGAIEEPMYVILDGAVSVTTGDRTLATLGTGDIVGELSLIDEAPCAAKVTTIVPSKAARISEPQFLYLIENHPFFAIEVMRTIAERLRSANTLN